MGGGGKRWFRKGAKLRPQSEWSGGWCTNFPGCFVLVLYKTTTLGQRNISMLSFKIKKRVILYAKVCMSMYERVICMYPNTFMYVFTLFGTPDTLYRQLISVHKWRSMFGVIVTISATLLSLRYSEPRIVS